jgi:hypothetical protein
MKTVLKWILTFILGFLLLLIHWSLFLVYIGILFWRTRVKNNRALQKLHAAEAEALVAQKLLFECEIIHATKDNEDGVNRQSILVKCYRGDLLTLKLVYEEGTGRVEAWTKFGQIGELPPSYVEQFAAQVNQGAQVEGRIKKMLNRSEGVAAISCMIEVFSDTEQQ